MKLILIFIICLQSWSTISMGADSVDKKWMKTIFKDRKCTICHTYNTLNIPQPPDKEDEEEDNHYNAIMDLSVLSKSFSNDHLKAKKYLYDYLDRKIKRKGKLHKFKIKGDKEEMSKLMDAILNLHDIELKKLRAK